MSSSASVSSINTDNSTGVRCEIEYDVVEEKESDLETVQGDIFGHGAEGEGETTGAYLDEPVADVAWLEQYYQKKEEDNERLKELQLRWEGDKPVTS